MTNFCQPSLFEELDFIEHIESLLNKRETVDLEFKSAKEGFPGSFWDTYSSFANTEGGVIVLGVKEKHGDIIVEGLSDEQIDAYKKHFWNNVNNKQNISINLLRDDDVKSSIYRGKKLLIFEIQYTKPFNEITGVVTELQTATAAAARVFALLDTEEEKETGDGKLDARGDVDIKNVAFSYTDAPLITDFNLNVKQGQRVAIVGPTGCGKTTLINLLMRFYDVDDGEIAVDGVPAKSLSRAELRKNFGMVLQDSWLFHGTIRDNIAYSKEDAAQEEIEAAAKKAHIHNFIMRLKDGYDTVISDKDDTISQGQRQLLCIARIMLIDPPILILDEATSNIDTRTEIRIQKAFAEMMKGRTSFIVAHRLSTIKEADVILVMKDGNVIEKGDHDSLMALGGFYKTLFEAGYGPSA